MFFGLKSGEDPQDFLDEFYIILFDMGVTSIDKAEWEAYKLNDVAQTWYVQWRDNRELGMVRLLGRSSREHYSIGSFVKI